MIDYHCHILPGLDDGASDIDESIAMAKSLVDAGYTTVCCTPHCMLNTYVQTPQQVREATLMLQADLDNAGIELELWTGMEYCLDAGFLDIDQALMPLGDSRLVLCETPRQYHPGLIQDGLQKIIDLGFIPLLAHPERSTYFFKALCERNRELKTQNQETPDLKGERQMPGRLKKANDSWLKRLLTARVPRQGSDHDSALDSSILPDCCLFQANLGSFTGFYGEEPQRRAYDLLKAGAFHCIATDLHDTGYTGKILIPTREKLVTNPMLKTLAQRTPADLEAIAERTATQPQETPADKQQTFEF